MVLRNAITLVSGTAGAQLVLMLLMPVLTRIYTAEDFGLLATFTSIANIIMAISALRYDMAVMLPEDEDEAKIVHKLANRCIFWTSVIATSGLALTAPVLAGWLNIPKLAPWLFFVGIASFSLAQIQSVTFWLNRRLQYKSISWNRLQQSGSVSGLQLVLGLTGFAGPGGLIIGQIFGEFMAMITIRHRGRSARQHVRETPGEMKRLLSRYKKMPLLNGPNILVDAVRINVTYLLVGIVFSTAALGQFSIAWKFLQLPMALINSALATIFYQKLARTPRGRMYSFAKTCAVRSALVGVAPFALIYFLSPWAFPLILGDEWQKAGVIAQVLTPWLFMNLITSPLSTIFIVTETQHLALIHSIAYAAVPLFILSFSTVSLLTTMIWLSSAMALVLVFFMAMCLWTAYRYDQGHHGSQSGTGAAVGIE